jgi:hypothetical protein
MPEAKPESKKKSLKANVIIGCICVVLMLLLVGVDTCMRDADTTADRIQQTKDDGETVKIGGLEWIRTTFYDEKDNCWRVYISDNNGNKNVFATLCPEE